MNYQVRFTNVAHDDIKRLYAFMLAHDKQAADAVLQAIYKGVELLKNFPFTCRKVQSDNPFLRETLEKSRNLKNVF